MGLMNQVFGGRSDGSTAGVDEQKYAVMVNAGPERIATAGNGLNYALDLDAAGYEVELFLDGKASKLPGAFEEDPDRPFNRDWQKVRQRGLLAGVCGFCANAFDAAESVERAGIDVLSDSNEHAPAVERLADEGYELVVVG